MDEVQNAQTDVLIIGGGLSGLALADILQTRGQDWQLLEAQSRLGGRIQSPEIGGAHFDLGPAWFWPGQPRMDALTRRLGVVRFAQYATGAMAYQDRDGTLHSHHGLAPMQGSLRLEGGMGALITALARGLPEARLHRGRPVLPLSRGGDGMITAATPSGPMRARRVVLALPPRVAMGTMGFEPDLPARARRAARDTPTWMAGQAKILALYDSAPWRDAGFSGDAMSQQGPMVEIHDASPRQGGPFGLFGFVGLSAQLRVRHEDEILALARDQLVALFGPAMATPRSIQMMDWARVPLIATADDAQGPTTHPRYGLPRALSDLWEGQLIFGSTETGAEFGGFLEGALEAAERVGAQLAGG